MMAVLWLDYYAGLKTDWVLTSFRNCPRHEDELESILRGLCAESALIHLNKLLCCKQLYFISKSSFFNHQTCLSADRFRTKPPARVITAKSSCWRQLRNDGRPHSCYE